MDDYFDVPVSSLTNGMFQIPLSKLPNYGGYVFVVQGLGANTNQGPYQVAVNCFGGQFSTSSRDSLPDGREHIRQNIEFQLRAGKGEPADQSLGIVAEPFNVFVR